MKCSIDAEYKGEERYSKLSLAYTTPEDEIKINKIIKETTPEFELTPEIYTSNLSNGKKVIVIEYHDDYDRAAGKVFEKILKILDITCLD